MLTVSRLERGAASPPELVFLSLVRGTSSAGTEVAAAFPGPAEAVHHGRFPRAARLGGCGGRTNVSTPGLGVVF